MTCLYAYYVFRNMSMSVNEYWFGIYKYKLENIDMHFLP